MKTTLYRVLVASLLLAIAAPHVEAAGEYASPLARKQAERKAREKAKERGGNSAFEAFFQRGKKKKQPTILRWFEDDLREPDKKKGTRAVERKQRDYADPEAIQGFGMGNVPFVLPKQVSVREDGIGALPAAGLEAESVKLVLSDRETPIRAVAPIRDAVVAHYKATGFKPLWTSGGKLTERGEVLVAVLASSFTDGLQPNRYLPRILSSFQGINDQVSGSALAVAQLEVALSISAVSYATHLSGGAFDPNKLSLYHDIAPAGVDPAAALRVLAFTPYVKNYLDSLRPTHPAYAAMKAELSTLRAQDVRETAFPEGKRIRVGQKDSRIPELRGRLIRLGHLDGAKPMPEDGDPEVLDKYVGRALKAFQAAEGIPQTSALDAATVRAFNADNTESNIERLLINMERVRWLPDSLGRKHVFVNQAAYEVDVVKDGALLWESKVIVGRPTTQTNVFSDVIENIVFNPPWGMPESILVNEYLGKLRRDPGYFDRIGYKVINRSGKVVSSRAINWSKIRAGSGIGVQQPPGSGNALGELKFNFPNHHAIYMHDTPNRNLFEESRRNFSHGCVRVQNPREFAALLLGLSEEEVAEKIESGASFTVKLKEHIPVHLGYFTAWPDNEGKMRYFSDPYERDETLKRALDIVDKSFAPDASIKVVEASSTASQ